VDRPRKEGGGRGGVGNLHDELQKDKYIKEGEETPVDAQPAVEQTEPKEPEKPEGITLDEYFRNKGIDFDTIGAAKKEPVKKGEVNAEWIKKEKLTVLQTKEDKKASEEEQKGEKKQNRRQTEKVGPSESLNSELFGFNAQPPKPEREPREQREPREHREHREPREHKPREHREPREPREPREQREPREHKEHREPRG
jgi:ribonuclease E